MKKARKRIVYSEGDAFAVPLRNGGYGAVVVARAGRMGKVILGYVLRARFREVPKPTDLQGVRPADAIKAMRMGDLGIIDGSWPFVAKVRDWKRSQWPMPVFLRREELLGRAWRVHYSDEDPNLLLREEPADLATDLESDSVAGSGAVEIMLTKMLLDAN